MSKMRNKKRLTTALVAFLLVFVIGSAFALGNQLITFDGTLFIWGPQLDVVLFSLDVDAPEVGNFVYGNHDDWIPIDLAAAEYGVFAPIFTIAEEIFNAIPAGVANMPGGYQDLVMIDTDNWSWAAIMRGFHTTPEIAQFWPPGIGAMPSAPESQPITDAFFMINFDGPDQEFDIEFTLLNVGSIDAEVANVEFGPYVIGPDANNAWLTDALIERFFIITNYEDPVGTLLPVFDYSIPGMPAPGINHRTPYISFTVSFDFDEFIEWADEADVNEVPNPDYPGAGQNPTMHVIGYVPADGTDPASWDAVISWPLQAAFRLIYQVLPQ